MDYSQYKQRLDRTEITLNFVPIPPVLNDHIVGFLKHHHWYRVCNILENALDMGVCSYCHKRYCNNCGKKEDSLCCKCEIKIGYSHDYKNKSIGPL